MPSEDNELKQLRARLRRVKARKKNLEDKLVKGDAFGEGVIRAQDRQIQTLEQQIRKREYVLSPKRS